MSATSAGASFNQSPIPSEAGEATLQAFDRMRQAISAEAYAIAYLAELHQKQAEDEGDFVYDRVPSTYGDDLLHVETSFAYQAVSGIFSLAQRARAMRGPDDPPLRRIVVRTDLDGTLVGHGDRWNLRGGFLPAIEYAQFVLSQEDEPIEIVVQPLSDRPQSALSQESRDLLSGLEEKGILLDATSSNDGELAASLPSVLKPARHEHDDDDPAVVNARKAAVDQIMDPEAVEAGHYYDRAAIVQAQAYGPGSSADTAYFVLDDASWAGHIRENPRVAGLWVRNAPIKEGGIQPLVPGDVFNY